VALTSVPKHVETVHAQANELLKRHWGYDEFRPGQWDVIAQVLAGRDALIVLPTGGGKSMCYQLPSLLLDGLTIVVSPLIALMQDQVDALKKRGIAAACLHSQLAPSAIEQIFTDAEFGRYRLLYMAPERFESELFQARASRLKVACLAIDEAHCISEWGYDFRPAYLAIPKAYPLLGHPPVVALTATATPGVRRDIAERLALRDPYRTVQGFDRPNIVWSVFRASDKRARLKDVLSGVPGCGVVYAATRRGVEQWSRQIAGMGVSVSSYHGGMEAQRREAEASTWLGGKTRVMVATNAFGMGIDHPGVRFVVHVDLPATRRPAERGAMADGPMRCCCTTRPTRRRNGVLWRIVTQSPSLSGRCMRRCVIRIGSRRAVSRRRLFRSMKRPWPWGCTPA
jgi:ATP-dependent DNA helicase RecQ